VRRALNLRALRRDTRGATIVEFGFVAPVMCVALMAAFDVGHTLYTRAMLQGVVQKTGRDFTLEDSASSQAQRDALDAKVLAQARALVNNADIKIDRRFYRTFSEAAAAKAEAFTDTNVNGKCDAGEPYQDENNNNVWDQDGGNAGVGGAKDAVVYTVTMTYARMLPAMSFVGGDTETKVSATTVLRNQPYGEQGNYAPAVVRNCP
jgi:Flp pilus assembly protein TadG